MSKVHLFVDTNFFIQCKKYDQIDWNIDELEDVSEIILMISRPVQSEIDRQKQDGNTRRAKRARVANSLFRQMLINGKELVSQVGDKQVIIKFAPSCKIQDMKTAVPDLDVDRNDDQLVATAKMYQQQNPGSDVRVLTQDTGMVISADRCGLSYIMTPDDWNLPPEKDDRDKKIAELEDKIRTLSAQFPIITMVDQVMTNEEPILLGELTEDVVDKLVSDIQERFPVAQDFPQARKTKPDMFGLGQRKFIPPTEEEIDEYRDRYDEWLDECRKWIYDVYDYLEQREGLLIVELVLANNGNVPVRHLLIEITAHGSIELAPPSQDYAENDVLEAPTPPDPPRGKWVSTHDWGLSRLAFTINQPLGSGHDFGIDFSRIPTRRDRYSFYWDGEGSTEFSQELTGECEEFRHKLEPIVLCISVRSTIPEMTVRGALSVLVTGENLPEPYKKNIPVTLSYIKKDTYSVLLKAIQNSFSSK